MRGGEGREYMSVWLLSVCSTSCCSGSTVYLLLQKSLVIVAVHVCVASLCAGVH